jgi:hypothetical protein
LAPLSSLGEARAFLLKPTNWKDTAELIGIAAIVASLVFVGLQLRQDREVALGQIYQSTLQAMIELDSTMAEHANVWAKARNGSDLTEAETIVLRRLINMWRLRAFYESQSGSIIDDGDWSAPVYRFAILLHENPTAKKLFIESVKRDERYFGGLNKDEKILEFHREVLASVDKLEELDD